MQKLKLTKVIASTLIVASVLTLNPIGASAEWESNATGWRYTRNNNTVYGYDSDKENYYCNSWEYIDGKWYCFDSNGYLYKNMITNDIGDYYVDENGAYVENAPTEVNEYIKYFKQNSIDATYNVLIDINQDGVKEILLYDPSARQFTSAIATYENGKVRVHRTSWDSPLDTKNGERLDLSNIPFYGYSKEEKEIFLYDDKILSGYKIENGEVKHDDNLVFSSIKQQDKFIEKLKLDKAIISNLRWFS